MKLTKIFALAIAAIATLSGCTPSDEEGFQGDGTGFRVTASAGVIYADDTDKVVFTATFNGFSVAADQITAYNKEDNNIMPLENLTFTTSEAGTYTFYFTYSKEGTLHTSEDVSVVAVEKAKLDFSPIEEEGLSITPSHTLFQVDVDEVYLIVRLNGVVQDAMEGKEVTFYDYSNNEILNLSTKRVTDDNGVAMYMYRYAPKEACIRTIWASQGSFNTKERPIKLTAVDIPIPMPAIDTDPTNASFNKKSLLLQLTGTACNQCPRMIQAVRNLWKSPNYADKFEHVAIHTFNSTDPMYYGSKSIIGAVGGYDSFPYYVFDLYYSAEHTDQNFKTEIDEAQLEPAKAGISARIECDGVSALARVNVKAAEDGEYYVAAMLVESNITATQQGDLSGEYSVHENALRVADGFHKPEGYLSTLLVGHPLGTLKAGQVGDILFNLPMKSNWVVPNCHIVFYVTTEIERQGKSSIVVTNAIASESLNCTVEYNYKEQ